MRLYMHFIVVFLISDLNKQLWSSMTPYSGFNFEFGLLMAIQDMMVYYCTCVIRTISVLEML